MFFEVVSLQYMAATSGLGTLDAIDGRPIVNRNLGPFVQRIQLHVLMTGFSYFYEADGYVFQPERYWRGVAPMHCSNLLVK